jgi:patatin-like phospholipase/acyl hydrolase
MDRDPGALRLLSLDGGGFRGLSSLYILKAIMLRLNAERANAGLPIVKPCEVFDLIGGTSTGGLIAIMLGRLEMDVDECIDAYRKLTETIFKSKKNRMGLSLKGDVSARFSSETLRDAIKTVVNETNRFTDTDPFNDQQSRSCRVYDPSCIAQTPAIADSC